MNNISIEWEVKHIKTLTPKWFAVFYLEIKNTDTSAFPNDIYPLRGEKYITVVWFVWKDFEIVEWYHLRIEWYFDRVDEQYANDYEWRIQLKIKGDIDLVGWLKTLSGLRSYLIRYIPWLGNAQTDMLIKTVWLENVITFLDNETAEKDLLKIKWIWEIKAKTIKAVWDEWKDQRNALIELTEFWLSINRCSVVFNTWWNSYKEILKENPYRLTEIRWIWFEIADKVAMNALNIWKKDSRRYAGIIEYICKKHWTDTGDTLIDISKIKENIKKFIATDDDFNNSDIDNIAKEWIDYATENNILYKINSHIYSLWYYAYIETRIARKIQEAISESEKFSPSDKINKYIDDIYNVDMITDRQKEAIANSLSNKISIILGWAWTWKTFTVGKIIDGINFANKTYHIIAPTNKAAARVREVKENAQVSTIHSLLQLIPWEDPIYDEANPLPFDYIIVDETSMADNNTAHKMLEAIDFSKTSIIFVWDHRQLPPVWAWCFYYDLINCGALDDYIVMLNEVKRSNNKEYEEKKSQGIDIKEIKPWIHNIVANSLRILNKEMPLNTWYDCFNFFSNYSNTQQNINDIKDKIINTYRKLLANNIDINKDFQLYIPTYKGDLWIPKFNSIISDLVNDNEEVVLEKWQSFKINDKVFYWDTDKELELTKGDVWIIKEINKEENVVKVEFYWQWLKELRWAKLTPLELGYALTVHKAQWTEIKYAWILMTNSMWMWLLNNQLFYTAYTRWKEKVFLFWEERAYQRSLINNINERNTLLFHLLAWTNLNEITLNVNRTDFSVDAKEIKQIKNELDIIHNVEQDYSKLIKVSYHEKCRYKYYRYVYVPSNVLKEFNIMDWQSLSLQDVENLESNCAVFVKIKKYTMPTQERKRSGQLNQENTLFVEINSYNKDIQIY